MTALSILVAAIMLLIAGFHFYWAFGGSYGLQSAGPVLEGKAEFKPGRLLTFIVALLLTGLAVLAVQLHWPWPPIKDYLPAIGYIVSVVFTLRAIGDFKYAGFFKKIHNSNFAKLDTKFFSPLVLFLSVAFAILSTYGAPNG